MGGRVEGWKEGGRWVEGGWKVSGGKFSRGRRRDEWEQG